MTGPIEQLWYTRPPASSDRMPGFQIIAASPGLADPRAKLTTMAMRLCRYDAPPRYAPPPAPVSYGWVDAGGTRFCFRRAPAKTDEHGRSGNVTAHVIAGPPGLLGAGDLAARFGSAWWWDGALPDGKDLPRLDSLDEVPPASPAAPEHLADWLAAFIDAVLARRPRTLLALRGSPADIAALVLAAERAVPGLMDAHSVSTYESPRTAPWFDIVGAVEPIPGAAPVAAVPEQRTPALVTAARTIMLSADRARVTRTAARAAGLGAEKPLVTALPGLVAAYSELDAGAAPSTRFLAESLASPAIARQTLDEFPEAHQHVAREVIRENGTVFKALAALAGNGIDDGVLAAIGDAAGRELVTGQVGIQRWSAVLQRLTALSPQAVTACRRRLIEQAAVEPTLLAGVGREVRLALLRQASADSLAQAHPAVGYLLRDLGGAWQSVADERGLPARWRAVAVIGAAPMSPAELAERLRGDPAIADPLADLLGGTAPLREAVLASPAGQQAPLLLDIAAAMSSETSGELLTWFARTMRDPGARLAFMAAAAKRGLPSRPRAEWAELARDAIAGQLTQVMASGAVPWPTSQQEDLLRAGQDEGSRIWLQVLALATREGAHVTPLKSAVADVLRLPAPQGHAALECAVTYFAARQPNSEQFTRALAALDRITQDGIALLVTACLLVQQSERDPRPGTELGCCLIDLVAAGQVVPSVGRGPSLSAEARRLARALPGHCRDHLEFHAAKRGKLALGWWKQETGVLARVTENVGLAVSSVKGLFGSGATPG